MGYMTCAVPRSGRHTPCHIEVPPEQEVEGWLCPPCHIQVDGGGGGGMDWLLHWGPRAGGCMTPAATGGAGAAAPGAS